MIWAVRHGHIGDAFFDLDAAAFLCSQLPNIQPAAATAVPSEDTPAAATPDQQGSSPSTAMTARMQSTANAAGVSPVACAGHIAHQQSSDASTGTLAHLQTPDCGRGDGQSPGLYGPPLVQAREHDTCLRDSSCGNQGVQEVNLDDQEALTQQQHPQVEQPKQKVVQQQHAQDKQPKQHGNSKGQEQQPDTSMHDMQQLPQRAHGRRRNKQTQPTNPCSSSGQSDDVQQAQQCAVSAHQSQPAKEDGRPVDKPAATNCNAAQDNSAGIQIKQVSKGPGESILLCLCSFAWSHSCYGITAMLRHALCQPANFKLLCFRLALSLAPVCEALCAAMTTLTYYVLNSETTG